MAVFVGAARCAGSRYRAMTVCRNGASSLCRCGESPPGFATPRGGRVCRAFRAKGEVSAGAVEGLNNKIRVVTRRSYGFPTVTHTFSPETCTALLRKSAVPNPGATSTLPPHPRHANTPRPTRRTSRLPRDAPFLLLQTLSATGSPASTCRTNCYDLLFAVILLGSLSSSRLLSGTSAPAYL
jgi:Transposase